MYWLARHAGPPGDEIARDAAHRSADTPYVLEGRVESPDIWLPGQSYFVFVLRADAVEREGERLALRGGVLVRWSDPGRPLYEAERVRVEAPIDLALGPVNPGASGMEDYYRRYGVHTGVRIRGESAVERSRAAPAFSPSNALSRFRGYLAGRIAQVVPASSLPLVLTIWLGDRRRLDVDTYQTFIDSGTAHVLAVSGVHVSIMFVTLGVLFPAGATLRRARLRAVFMIVVVTAFVVVTGARVSSVRAALMVAVYLAADWFGRERDAPTALSIAGIGFLVYEPNLLFDAGFQLSFLSIASILVFSEPIARGLTVLPFSLRHPTAATLSVQFLPLPVAIHSFYVLPIVAPLVNLLVIPVTTVLLWVGFVASLVAVVFPPAAAVFGQALHVLAQVVLWLAKESARPGWAHLHVAAPTSAALVLYAAGMLAFWLALAARARRVVYAMGSLAAFVACAAAWRPVSPRPEMTVMDVGHGDAIFVRAPGGATMLVDAGNRSNYADLGRRAVAPFLWANHETRLDALLITHPDADHIGGARYVLENFRVGALVLGPRAFPGTMEDEVIAICARKKVPVRRVALGDRFALGGAAVEVLHPPRENPPEEKENELSLTVRVSWPGFSALLPGDVESWGEGQIAQAGAAAQVLKVPHHGSATSSSPAFIQAVNPKVAIVSVGPRGRSNVLKPEVIARYRQRGITVLRTDIVGGVRIRTAKDSLEIEAARLKRGYIVREVEEERSSANVKGGGVASERTPGESINPRPRPGPPPARAR
jgi:competence protein ComEC